MANPVLTPEFEALQSAVAGRYSIVRELGRGGMGVVFLAREVALDRLVAIKLLPLALAQSPAHRERFLREARTAAGLAHPHIVSIHTVEQAGDVVFFVMEYVPGESLGARLRRSGPLPAADALRVTQEIAWALAHAHARGVVHRDVKPDNILLEEGTDRALVTDFGIARSADGDGSAVAGMGTLHYMSPEQANGAAGDARSDVYALGVTAYEAVSGHRPFDGYDGAALLAQQAAGPPPSLGRSVPSLPSPFVAAVDRAIAPDPAQRWPDVETMARELAMARALTVALPAPLRAFARVSREQLGRAASAFGLAVATEAVLLVGFGFEDLAAVLFHAMASLLLGIGAIALAGIVAPARDLLRRGYGHAAANRAITAEEVEEQSVPEVMRRRDWRDSPAVVLIVSGLMVTASIGMVRRLDSFVLGLLLVLVAVYTPMLAFLRLRRRSARLRGWWARVMRGRFGAWLFRFAGLGLEPVEEAPTSGQPTVLALGEVIGSLFNRLPEAQRRALSAVPDLVERLEALAFDGRGPRGEAAVSALETLRLDLLRLQAGQLAEATITEDLRKLQEIGYRVDAELEAGDVRRET